MNGECDTSALAKRYLTEAGSAWVRSWIEPSAGNVIIISDIAIVEFQSVLARHRNDGLITPAQELTLYTALLADRDNEYLSVPLEVSVLKRAGNLVSRYVPLLRIPDALQLASALEAEVSLGEKLTFISGDKKLLSFAVAEGLTTDDPYAHP